MLGKPAKTFKAPNGEILKMYRIKTLADALGRETNTIRKWEIAGTIPQTPFRDKSTQVHSRLYSAEQIEIIVKTAEECKIRDGVSISRTGFTRKVRERLVEYERRIGVRR